MEHARSFTAQARRQTAEVAGSQRNNESLGPRKRVWRWRTRTRGSSGPYWLKMSPTARQRRVLPLRLQDERSDGVTGKTGFFQTLSRLGTRGRGPVEEKKRRFHQGPRVTTLNFEAGYMLAVFSKNVVS